MKGKQNLNKLQNRSTQAALGKAGNWWKKDAGITDKIAKNSRNAVP